ncbi:MAG: transporter substrate-binding domain-containing protein [Deltaproteobacteria bacterium]|nr:transporter substrate-binding domain-containing protein [Deltaproteobacteria bacterium]
MKKFLLFALFLAQIFSLSQVSPTPAAAPPLSDTYQSEKNTVTPEENDSAPNFAKIELTAAEKAYLDKKKVITMCVDPDWMPLEKIENGRHIGMTADYIRILEKIIGYPIVMVPTRTWTESIAFAKARKCDIYSLAMPTPERRTYMNFTRPYLSIPLVMAARTETPFIDNIALITDKKIGIVKGYAFNETLRKRFPKMQIVDVASVPAGLKLVVEGKIFGFIGTLATVGYTIQKDFVGELKVAGKFDERWELGIAARNDEPLLVEIFDKAIAAINPFTHQQILNNWIAVHFDQKTNYGPLLQILLIVLAGLAILIFRNHTLGKYNKKLERQNLEISRQTEKLKETEQKLLFTQHAVDNCAFPIIWSVHSPEPQSARIIHANKAASSLLGYTLGELQQISIKDLDESCTQETWEQTLKRMQSLISFSRTTAYRCKNGSLLPVEIYLNYFEYEGKAYNFTFFQDISRQQEMEAKLNRSMKMEAVGLMAGGVAHDLNNILSGIISYPELLLMKLEPESPLRKPLETILNSGKRAAEVVADMLTVTRGVAATRNVADVNHIIESLLESPEVEVLKKNYAQVTIKTSLENSLLAIECSEVHLRKSLLNLLLNAFEAIKAEGTVTLTTCNHYIEEPVAENNFLSRGEYIKILISDTGSGISAADQVHIFEPFYTKKIMGRSGTGLGLTVVWNTIRDHDGDITVKSDTNGTTFTIFLPATRKCRKAEETEHGITTAALEKLQGREEKILIVDDEKIQRDIAEQLLQAMGYLTQTAKSGEEGLELFARKPFDLVLLDMLMDPGINGRRTYARMLEIKPGLKAVIASGFSENEEVQKALALGPAIFIKKPYTITQLGMAVQELLKR